RLILTAPPTAWESRTAQADLYEQAARLIERQGLKAFEAALAQAPVPPVFANVTGDPARLTVSGEMLPAILRGAAKSNLPPLATLAGLKVPILLLAWSGDPVHPLSTARQLVETLPDARLYVADTPEQLRTWGDVAAAFLND
ncbi:MAG TPA: hypothetical protein VGC34_04795, partial [Steroidobacteraceae bacterium]